jgi:2-methylcitrate dehydratase PrpD
MEIVNEPALQDKEAGIRGTRIDIVLKDGSVKSETILLPKGDPEVPLQGDDMIEKLRSCASDLYDKETQQNLYDTSLGLHELDNVSKLMELVSKIS